MRGIEAPDAIRILPTNTPGEVETAPGQILNDQGPIRRRRHAR